MKKVILLALVLMVSIPTIAQEERRGPEHRMEMKKKRFADLSPEQRAELKTKRMALALDLTEKQQREMLALNTSLAKERKDKMEERKALKESGKELSSDQKFELQNERLDKQLAVQKKIKSILTPEQYETWKKMKKAKHRKKRMKGERHNKKRK